MSGGAPQFEKLPEMIQFGGLVAIANTSLALLAVSVLWLDPLLLALLVVPLLTVFLAYRAYVSEREKHERLELLYQSSRILQHSPELDSALSALLEHGREMFRAERAEILLWPQDEGVEEGLLTVCEQDQEPRMMVPRALLDADRLHQRVAHERRAFLYLSPDRSEPSVRNAMAAPLLGEAGLIGSMVVFNRLTEGTTFSDDDLRLLETLANQAAVALENGQLEQSLAELSRLKEQLRFQAYHDPLTGLANRSLFAEQVNASIQRPTPGRIPVVLFLDLDNFKDVNDAMGHPAGDRLLTAVAERVQSCVRSGDMAARLGGDEFAVLLVDEPDLASAVSVATRLIAAFAVTFPIGGQDLKVSASIGIAASSAAADQADDLLRNADVAMYTAKQAGKNRFAVFDPTMHAAIVARHAMSNELSHAVDEGEIDVFYQPVLSLATGLTFGVEALARWRHPTRGFVEPDEFIPLAEESGAILALGRAVLFEACREAGPWRSGTGEGISLTVNLSAAQLASETFIDELVDVLRATGFPATRLVLEMTETVMFADTQTTIARLSALRDLGVRIAVDDFGTGYSSLGYLRRFKVDILKIAREFVAPAESGPDGWAFANAIVALGRSLGLRIIAEGIEVPDQLEQLRAMGCEFGQGFLFAKAMPGEEMAERLRPPAVRRGPGRSPVPVTALSSQPV
jgi:diguanylate cyclase (GGDEF)-like protein